MLGFASSAQPIKLTLTGVRGFTMADANSGFNPVANSLPIDRDVLLLAEFEILDLDNIDLMEIASLLKPSFDIIWNSCDRPKSSNYDQQGNSKLVLSEK